MQRVVPALTGGAIVTLTVLGGQRCRQRVEDCAPHCGGGVGQLAGQPTAVQSHAPSTVNVAIARPDAVGVQPGEQGLGGPGDERRLAVPRRLDQ